MNGEKRKNSAKLIFGEFDACLPVKTDSIKTKIDEVYFLFCLYMHIFVMNCFWDWVCIKNFVYDGLGESQHNDIL